MAINETGMFGMWSCVSKKFVFGIQEPSKNKAYSTLFNQIGKDGYKYRFEVRKIKDCEQHRSMFKQGLEFLK